MLRPSAWSFLPTKSRRSSTKPLKSVFAQTFTDYEVIVVNDGSPDTEEFERAIKPYLDRIRYLKQRKLAVPVWPATRDCCLPGENSSPSWMLTIFGCRHYLEAQMKFIRERGCDLGLCRCDIFGDAANESRTYMETR